MNMFPKMFLFLYIAFSLVSVLSFVLKDPLFEFDKLQDPFLSYFEGNVIQTRTLETLMGLIC